MDFETQLENELKDFFGADEITETEDAIEIKPSPTEMDYDKEPLKGFGDTIQVGDRVNYYQRTRGHGSKEHLMAENMIVRDYQEKRRGQYRVLLHKPGNEDKLPMTVHATRKARFEKLN